MQIKDITSDMRYNHEHENKRYMMRSALFVKGPQHGCRIAATRRFIACNYAKNALYSQKLP